VLKGGAPHSKHGIVMRRSTPPPPPPRPPAPDDSSVFLKTAGVSPIVESMPLAIFV